ncbi:MAG: zinc ABC transporter substrate-binding protein [Thermodesulfobacteriota bacterium]|nr:zinc ABC transporter substrate-binding protein [Thermodesulfobacteriota bacterium]
MNRRVLSLLLLVPFLMALASQVRSGEEKKLNVGVTLHPYYSWVSNIVGDTADVTPIIPTDADPHSYQPRTQDLANLRNLDVIVINDVGHDEYIKPMLKSAGSEDLYTINTSIGLPLIPIFQQTYSFEGEESSGGTSVSYNSHTYIAITGAIQQINTIARELGKLRPGYADLYKKNARAYAKRLRRMLAGALEKVNAFDTTKVRIATVHDGYAYLMQELGLEIAAVIQPRHGIEPNPRQLQDTINRIKGAGVNVLFTELDYQKRYVDIIYEETGCRIYRLSHISHGPYTADKFERDIQGNLDDIIKALTDAK